jgi:glycosyltransferase involved in cell wall biosynthesis
LPAAIRAALASEFEDFEVIISDNFSRPSAQEIVSSFDDDRIRYLRTDRRLNMADHWEFAWQQVRGEFVMYVGDDNALRPDILAIADSLIREHDLDMLSWRVCSYFHPDWDVAYAGLPNRGNILSFEPGTTARIYRCNPAEILQAYCDRLRLPACFPVMLNCVFRRDSGEAIRKDAGRLFWPVNPDIAVTYFLLGVTRANAFALLDSYGAIGGRSKNSILAALLSRGHKSRRAHDLLAEFGTSDVFPHHPVKFPTMTNSLAATISQASKLLPAKFAAYRYSSKILALRVIDDIYAAEIVPWADDPEFQRQVEDFFQSLPTDERDEVLAYRRQCIEQKAQTAAASSGHPGSVTEAGRRLWAVGDTYFADMTLFGAHDIAETAARLPFVLELVERPSDRFVASCRSEGYIGDEIVALSTV